MANPKRTIPPTRPDNTDYEDHPEWGRTYGTPEPLKLRDVAVKVLGRLLEGGLQTWTEDDVARATGHSRDRDKNLLELGRLVWSERLKVFEGKQAMDAFRAFCDHLHGTEGYTVNLCFMCGDLWHPWSYDDEGMPHCPRFETEEPVEGKEAA